MKMNDTHSVHHLSIDSIDWGKINDEYEKSGLPQKIFCQNNHIQFNQFTYQRQRLKHHNQAKKKLAPVVVREDEFDFVSHRTVKACKGFILEWPNGKRLIIPIDTNAQALNIVLTELGRVECFR